MVLDRNEVHRNTMQQFTVESRPFHRLTCKRKPAFHMTICHSPWLGYTWRVNLRFFLISIILFVQVVSNNYLWHVFSFAQRSIVSLLSSHAHARGCGIVGHPSYSTAIPVPLMHRPIHSFFFAAVVCGCLVTVIK